MKGYVGGLGASASKRSHVGPVGKFPEGDCTDDLVESFTVCGFLLFRQHEHMKRKDLCLRMQADVRRFDVKEMLYCIST